VPPPEAEEQVVPEAKPIREHSRSYQLGQALAREARQSFLVPGLREIRRAMSWVNGRPVETAAAVRIQEHLASVVGETKAAVEATMFRPAESGELAAAARDAARVTVLGPAINLDRKPLHCGVPMPLSMTQDGWRCGCGRFLGTAEWMRLQLEPMVLLEAIDGGKPRLTPRHLFGRLAAS
jgi:hypothetical protein